MSHFLVAKNREHVFMHLWSGCSPFESICLAICSFIHWIFYDAYNIYVDVCVYAIICAYMCEQILSQMNRWENFSPIL